MGHTASMPPWQNSWSWIRHKLEGLRACNAKAMFVVWLELEHVIDFCWGCLGSMAQSGVAVSGELLGLVCRAHLGRTVRNSVGTLLGGSMGTSPQC